MQADMLAWTDVWSGNLRKAAVIRVQNQWWQEVASKWTLQMCERLSHGRQTMNTWQAICPIFCLEERDFNGLV